MSTGKASHRKAYLGNSIKFKHRPNESVVLEVKTVVSLGASTDWGRHMGHEKACGLLFWVLIL